MIIMITIIILIKVHFSFLTKKDDKELVRTANFDDEKVIISNLQRSKETHLVKPLSSMNDYTINN